MIGQSDPIYVPVYVQVIITRIVSSVHGSRPARVLGKTCWVEYPEHCLQGHNLHLIHAFSVIIFPLDFYFFNFFPILKIKGIILHQD